MTCINNMYRTFWQSCDNDQDNSYDVSSYIPSIQKREAIPAHSAIVILRITPSTAAH
uniref:Uncharacterized protein n=1 Tax=Rhizophagus irregularis (strain DAOM 181602 / DAOM 197198 / MUCL 43194) TaxID=747089 RepID=U9T699_RHIID